MGALSRGERENPLWSERIEDGKQKPSQLSGPGGSTVVEREGLGGVNCGSEVYSQFMVQKERKHSGCAWCAGCAASCAWCAV